MDTRNIRSSNTPKHEKSILPYIDDTFDDAMDRVIAPLVVILPYVFTIVLTVIIAFVGLIVIALV